MKNLSKLLLIPILLASFQLAAELTPQQQKQAQEVAAAIKNTFETNLFQLPPRIQGHYGIRLYRISGQPKYLPAALYDYYVVSDRFHQMKYRLTEESYVKERSKELTDALSTGTRGKARRKAIESFPEFIFYADELLRYASRLDEFGVEIPKPYLDALKAYDFLPGLTDKAMIRAWAAQLANYVYWLKQLGIADHSQAYKEAFQKAYPDSEDNELSRWHFRNKLYGLTHFVFAASHYYQHHVSEQEFGWILDYFADNEKRIFKQGTDDIIAEVGLSFRLTQQGEHPLVDKTIQHLLNSFDAKAGMVPSVSGKVDLASGEHRNVLTYMLFTWPEKLYPGPYFEQMDSVKKYLPMHQLEQAPMTQGVNE